MENLKRVLTVNNIANQKVTRVPFTGGFYQAFGQPQDRGIWFVWGASGSGKSSFLMQLAKAFARFYKVHYNPLEEDVDDLEYIARIELFNMHEVSANFKTQQYGYYELLRFIKRRRSPKVIFIDSLRYLTREFAQYQALKEVAARHQKILVCSGFAKGQDPRSEFEYQVMHDAKMKIFVSGYAAYCKGRTIGPNGGIYIAYKEGYEKLNGAGASDTLSNQNENE